MSIKKVLSFTMAIFMIVGIVLVSMPRMAVAASLTKANSFTVTETGIEVNQKKKVTFTSRLDRADVYDLTVYDENGDKVTTLKQDPNGNYSASVELFENQRITHTYTLNTSNPDEYTCEINFYAPITKADMARDDKTWANVKSYYSRLEAQDLSDKEILTTLFLALSMDKNVSRIWFENDSIINFDTLDGVGNVFDLNLVSTRRANTTAQYQIDDSEAIVAADENYSEPVKSADYIGSKKIRVIAPFYGVESDFTTRYVDEAERIANVINGTVTASYGNGKQKYPESHDNHPNQPIGTGAADVTAFKNLDGYGIIMVDSHGSLYNGQSLICVFHQTGTTSADFSAKRLVRYDDPVDPFYSYVGVLGSYISYYSNSLPNSVVFLGSCYGMHSSHLADAFTGLGAGYVTGFSQSVAFLFETKLFTEYFKLLRTPNTQTGVLHTTKEAFDAAVDRFGSVDPYGSEKARWKNKGNGNIRLGEYFVPVKLESFTITPSELFMKEGETAQLQVVTVPADAIKTCRVIWETFDSSTATVTEDGLVTAKRDGSTIITCAVTDKFGTTLNKSVEVEIEEQAEQILVGDVTGDGTINTGDAVAILKYAANMITLDDRQMKAANTVKDDVVNTADAVAIIKYAAGMITEF